MKRRLSSIPINTDNEGNASTILAGYYKYGVATLIGGGIWYERDLHRRDL